MRLARLFNKNMGLGLDLGFSSSTASASGPLQTGPFYNSAGIYFAPATIGATEQSGPALTPAGGSSFDWTTLLIIAAVAGGLIWYANRK